MTLSDLWLFQLEDILTILDRLGADTIPTAPDMFLHLPVLQLEPRCPYRMNFRMTEPQIWVIPPQSCRFEERAHQLVAIRARLIIYSSEQPLPNRRCLQVAYHALLTQMCLTYPDAFMCHTQNPYFGQPPTWERLPLFCPCQHLDRPQCTRCHNGTTSISLQGVPWTHGSTWGAPLPLFEPRIMCHRRRISTLQALRTHFDLPLPLCTEYRGDHAFLLESDLSYQTCRCRHKQQLRLDKTGCVCQWVYRTPPPHYTPQSHAQAVWPAYLLLQPTASQPLLTSFHWQDDQFEYLRLDKSPFQGKVRKRAVALVLEVVLDPLDVQGFDVVLRRLCREQNWPLYQYFLPLYTNIHRVWFPFILSFAHCRALATYLSQFATVMDMWCGFPGVRKIPLPHRRPLGWERQCQWYGSRPTVGDFVQALPNTCLLFHRLIFLKYQSE
jgi:hypothetical protein